ncbi:IS4 family transposase, partial [Bradyrhizobium sp. Mp27]|nr:IS4 family transposase [Bradyrhizobium sp. Mp27]
GGHFEATRERVAAREGPILVLHDTTEFSLKREKPDLIVNRRLTGTPYRPPKGTPLIGVLCW